MQQFERIYQLHQILANRRTPIPRAELADRLGCSRATLTRLISMYRDRLLAPIEFVQDQGYQLDTRNGERWELPGLWFSATEIYSLLSANQLLKQLKPGLLEPHVAPLRQRLETLLAARHAGSKALMDRIRILPMAGREPRLEEFQKTAEALIKRRQLRIQYRGRADDRLSERDVSPQRLVYYRDNWYLDAWCHQRQALRTFSLDRLHVSELLAKARDVADAELDAHVGGSYGIFAGEGRHNAVIHFSSKAARWVADELWHPQQQTRVLSGGGWELIVPYGNPTELLRDILKFGPDAQVIAPPPLRELVKESLQSTLKQYQKPLMAEAEGTVSRKTKGQKNTKE
tara:strand:- start:41826 stop:42857 length:1032 start_codon:yes stop_codon:yes gene_type:complete